MAKVNLGGQEYDTDIIGDVQAIVDKIKAAANGEDIPGVHVFNLAKKQKTSEEGSTGSGITLTGVGVFLGIIALLFLPVKK